MFFSSFRCIQQRWRTHVVCAVLDARRPIVNGYVKDAAHEALGQPGRRGVSGLAPQRLTCVMIPSMRLPRTNQRRSVGLYRILASTPPEFPRPSGTYVARRELPTGVRLDSPQIRGRTSYRLCHREVTDWRPTGAAGDSNTAPRASCIRLSPRMLPVSSVAVMD